MTNVHHLPKSKTALNLEAIRMSTKPRKRKTYAFVFDGARAPDRIRFDESATLRPIAWGKPDPALGATVCGELPKIMPAQGKGFGIPWQWSPRAYVPRWVGYAAVALLVLGSLAGFAR